VSGLTPTQLTIRKLTEDGWPLIEVVERYDHRTRRRHDLFGFIDVLAVGPDGTLAVQTTSYSNVSSRVNKIKGHENTEALRQTNWRIVVHGWRKKKGKWIVREVDLTHDHPGR
jgi:hypothetical protein